jgi:hypothetical protein
MQRKTLDHALTMRFSDFVQSVAMLFLHDRMLMNRLIYLPEMLKKEPWVKMTVFNRE